MSSSAVIQGLWGVFVFVFVFYLLESILINLVFFENCPFIEIFNFNNIKIVPGVFLCFNPELLCFLCDVACLFVLIFGEG